MNCLNFSFIKKNKPRFLKKFYLIIFIIFSCNIICTTQHSHDHDHDRKITFPDVPGYKTIKCDFHQHAIFSDGKVHPDIRVEEAIRDGLDAISITEHLEYQPHKLDIPHPDRNRAFKLALKKKKKMHDSILIIVNGVEITRSMPPGHSNAIFISDANKLLIDDPIQVFREANKQDAFVFWNHPHWKGQVHDGVARLTDMHKLLIKEKLIHGIEIVNGDIFSTEAIDIALANNLTFIGASDIHGLIDWDFHVHQGGHRPITLVFAKEKSEQSIKKAMFDGQTVVWYKNTLIGHQELLAPLIKASLEIKSAHYDEATWPSHKKEITILEVLIKNNSDASYNLRNTSNFDIHNNAGILIIPPQQEKYLQIRTHSKLENIILSFEVLNTVIKPNHHAIIELDIVIDKKSK
ncbi:MAG: Sb-PDE family phosphodiesterase [Saprospiraceae bacterium]